MTAPDVAAGVAGVLIGGLFNGSFVAPMKLMRRWSWEAAWLVYSLSGLVVIPWLAALATVPGLFGIYAEASTKTLLSVLGYGLGWGVGSVLFGIGVNRMGLAVGYGLILGLIAPIGTFYPMLVLHRERLFTAQGRALILGTLIVLAGIFLCAKAGRLRELATGRPSAARTSFGAGLLICILAGVFSPMLNFTFVFGAELQQRALAAGAAQSMSSNAIWPLALTAGALTNAGYALWLLRRNRTAGELRRPLSHWALGCAMGALCFASFLVYGHGATELGELGGIVGWPLFMSMALITSNALGALSGEWRGAPRAAWGWSVAGIGLLIVAITVIAQGGAQ
ncbi:MAG: L-rhamnose/proton symporter RhaT [Bryobacteraceae bacterium]